MRNENESSKVKIKEQLDNLIYWSYNNLANISFLCSKHKRIVQPNIKFKNVHAGERCFILGTGPSLKKINLDILKEEIIFGVNFYYKSALINSIVPRYYCLYDEIFHTTHKDSTEELIRELPDTTFFVRTKAFEVINQFNIGTKNVYYEHCNLYQYGDLIKFDMTKNMTAPFNVILGCLQTAIYMGFKEIYLLGCDFNSFASLKVEHCYDKGDAPARIMPIGFELKYYSMVSYHHYAIEKYARKRDISIYNLTPNSLLDAYERKSLESVLQEDNEFS